MRYRLEKYAGPRTRHTCPNCGKKGEFTRYIDENGMYFGEDIGRCNRVIKCGYHKKPGREAMTDGAAILSIEAPVGTFMPKYLMDRYDTNEYIALMPLFSRYGVSLDRAREMGVTNCNRYADGVLYWEIVDDQWVQGVVRIRYAKNMRRRKDVNAKYLNKHFGYEYRRRYPFGFSAIQHDKPICVVESQKTAVVMDAIYPNYNWVASCGQYLDETIKVVKSVYAENDMILFPDVGTEALWARYAMKYRCGVVKIKGNPNDDILDYIERGGKIEL